MNFIIFDLEWNNAYNYKLKRGMNEIIEIGAVKLDENLDVVEYRLKKPLTILQNGAAGGTNCF